jgi:hypothetical protein
LIEPVEKKSDLLSDHGKSFTVDQNICIKKGAHDIRVGDRYIWRLLRADVCVNASRNEIAAFMRFARNLKTMLRTSSLVSLP